ncbi:MULTISPECIES: hypothetical protein [Bradyrhizobium]|uniref:Uncharacterized protein n=1 Tax=Bradyrhizobium septentrionale TaxID=1404411 RepID=A0A974A687_9BRAD|nr:hypothetical protein [Bradyrhizobium septentrionale]UGY18741.1 hypothetical protein HAP48_0015565 [Bradyrhizobium septentrionale]UGY27472.1 hypothetical protein HU675_0012315 [Bradyrhizobium septentrionale]
MKPRGQLIIDEFELLRSVAGKSGLQLPPEITQQKQHLRKRDQLFKKLKLDPNNEHHVAFLCSIVYDHLYLNKPSATEIKFGDDKDFDVLERFIRFAKSSQLKRPSVIRRHFIKKDEAVHAEHGNDTSADRFRMRLNRAAKKAIAGQMKLTAKRKARLQIILPEVKKFFGSSYEVEQGGSPMFESLALPD